MRVGKKNLKCEEEEHQSSKGKQGTLMGVPTGFEWILMCCATFSQAFSCLFLVLCAVMKGCLQKGKKGEKRVRKAARISHRDPGYHLPRRKR